MIITFYVNFGIAEVSLLIIYIVSGGSAMRPLLEDHSERTYQKELDHMKSNAEMAQLKEVNTSIINKEEEPKEKFSKQEDVQNLSETNYLNESTQTAGRKI